MDVGEQDASTIGVFIPFRTEAYTYSAARRVILRKARAHSVIIGMVRVRCGNFEKAAISINGRKLEAPLCWNDREILLVNKNDGITNREQYDKLLKREL